MTGQDPRATSAPFSKQEIALIKQAILTPVPLAMAVEVCGDCGTSQPVVRFRPVEEER
jgi:hypothetical protein